MADRDTKEAEALLGALNRSAERLQTLWFTFLGLTIYFVITALTTTHRMLLLDEVQSLPIVNLKVPLLPFFIIAPLFYVVLHFYMLMMLVLLARSATVFEDSLARALPINADREQFRMRAENALFLQLLIGAKEEREGFNGRLLATIAIITLALAPVGTLIVMQMKFLPYHHFEITWWHRGLVVVDVALVLFLWRGYRHRRGRALPHGPVTLWRGLSALSAVRAIPAILGILTAGWLTLWEGRWAGEPMIDPVRREHQRVLIDRGVFADRLNLRNETIVGEALFIEKQKEAASGGGGRQVPTRDFGGRNFAYGDFSYADLRGVSFSNFTSQGREKLPQHNEASRETDLHRATFNGALMHSANFAKANLTSTQFYKAQVQRGRFFGANLQDSQLVEANLQGADFYDADLRGTYFGFAKMQGADLSRARMQLSDLSNALLQAAILERAEMQGADFTGARFQGAQLPFAELQGAVLKRAKMQGADLTGAKLHGADLSEAELQGAILRSAELNGANLTFSQMHGATLALTNMQGAKLLNSFVFRAITQDLNLDDAFLAMLIPEKIIFASYSADNRLFTKPLSPEQIDAWHTSARDSLREFNFFRTSEEIREAEEIINNSFDRLRIYSPDLDEDESNYWQTKQKHAARADPNWEKHGIARAAILVNLACNADLGSPYIVRTLMSQTTLERDFLQTIGERLRMGRKNSEACPIVVFFTPEDWLRVDEAAPEKQESQ